MKLVLSKDKRHVLIKPVGARDLSFLQKFPALLGSRGKYYFPAKSRICKNIIARIKASSKRKVEVDKGVYDLYTSEDALLDIPESFKYFTSPLHHQEIALRFLYTNGGGGLLLDPGLGKTKVVLDYIALMDFRKSFIVCPKALLFVWEDEVRVHRPDKTIHLRRSMTWETKIRRAKVKLEEAEDPTIQRRLSRLIAKMEKDYEEDERLTREADIVVANYEKCVQGQFELMQYGFEFMAVDEGLVKDHRSQRSKAILAISRTVKSVVIMSGTLVNNTPLDVFSPIRIMEPSLVGGSFTNFQKRYCHMAEAKDESGNVKNRFTVGFKDVDEVRTILEACSIIMRKEEWLDLPEKIFQVEFVSPTDEQMHISSELAANYITEYDNRYIEVDNPLSLMAKLYQVSNGFLYAETEEEDIDLLNGQESKKSAASREILFLKDNPKIDKAREILSNDLKHKKFILWYNLNAEYAIIQGLLEEIGMSYTSIRGGEKHTGDKVRDFNTNPNLQALVCQAKSVNYGITVLGTKEKESSDEALPYIDPQVYTEFFFSLGTSLEVFIQQQDRIHRIGQERETTYVILVNETPVELKMKEAMDTKTVLRNRVLVDFTNQLREAYLV